jgi:D-alanyl-D-alanine carboxypeptidase (penicillin-binding protein 5/6)
MRLVVRLLIAGLALASGGSLAGCSGAAGLADAQGATNPVATVSAPPPGRAVTATVPAAAATKTSDAAEPTLDVVGAPRGIKAKEGILVDATTGQVLWSKSADVPRPIASITKVMTALVILQAGGLNREITVPKAVVGYVAKYGAEAAGLIPGQWYTTNELLHIMLVMSAADAAYTLANAYGPGLQAFIAKMNVEASDLGLADTHFTSPDGLPYPTEVSTYSTPADLVTLGEKAMQNPVFRSIVDLKYYNLPKGEGHKAVSATSDDVMLGNYAGLVGIKTGYTDAAAHTFLFESVRNGRILIGAVLGSPVSSPFTGFQDAAKVLNWGFALKQTG